MSDLLDLYQDVILDHNRRPRNFGTLDAPDRSAEGDNPLCGDTLRVQVALDGDRVDQIAFEGTGCAISTASASLMTEAIRGKTVGEAKALFEKVHEMLTGSGEAGGEVGKLEVLSGVREYPMRVKCATLAWHTLQAALEGKDEPVSTEEG